MMLQGLFPDCATVLIKPFHNLISAISQGPIFDSLPWLLYSYHKVFFSIVLCCGHTAWSWVASIVISDCPFKRCVTKIIIGIMIWKHESLKALFWFHISVYRLLSYGAARVERGRFLSRTDFSKRLRISSGCVLSAQWRQEGSPCCQAPLLSIKFLTHSPNMILC